MLLQIVLSRHPDGSSPFSFPLAWRDLLTVFPRLFCLFQPLSQDWHQLAGVFEAQLEVLEPTDGSLAEICSMNGSKCSSHVRLSITELYPADFELVSEVFQSFEFGRVAGSFRGGEHERFVVVVAGR